MHVFSKFRCWLNKKNFVCLQSSDRALKNTLSMATEMSCNSMDNSNKLIMGGYPFGCEVCI